MIEPNTNLPPLRYPHSANPKKSSAKPILITLLCSILLAGGSCFGFLRTLDLNQNSSAVSVFALGFVAGVLLFWGACIWAAVAFLVHFFRGFKGDR